LCLITFELVFDKFYICIERDEGSDINCVFGLMIGDLVKELETWKEVALFAVLDFIMTTSPYKRFVYSPCSSLRIRNRASQHLLFTIKREKLKRT
jgi:hypothetical protein